MQRKEILISELKRINEVVINEYQPDRLILFGSLVNGNVHEWSDIDLAIVKNTSKSFIHRTGDLLKLVRPSIGLNVVVYTPQEVSEMEKKDHYFWVDEIIKKGKVLYERPV